MKNIIETIREKESKFYTDQVVAIKNSKSRGQLVSGLNAVIVNGKLEGFLWTLEEVTYNRYGGKNCWDIVYSAMSMEYTFREEESRDLNLFYLKENEAPTTITFGRRNGADYKYILTDGWMRPTKFRLVQIQEEYIPLMYSLVPQLTIRRWNGENTHKDIFVPKQILYPYAENNEPVLCCTYDQSLGYLTAYWDGECVRWKSTKQEIHLDWCFLPKSKEELINKINSKKEPVEFPTENEYTSSSDEERPRRRRKI